jgi:hypothetical protein
MKSVIIFPGQDSFRIRLRPLFSLGLEVIEKTWDDAVNDTANLWLSIFYRALGLAKALELYGIPAPKGELGKGWFCG